MNRNHPNETAMKFEKLLDSSRKQNLSLEINPGELHQEVLDFVLDNIKISKVLEELQVSGTVLFSKDLTQLTEEVCVGHFHLIAQSTGMPVGLVVSQILARQLFDVVNHESTGRKFHHLLPEQVKQKVKGLLDIINRINGKGTNCFDRQNFIKNLSNKDIPMELVWLLNEHSVVSFRVCFLSWCSDEEWLERFCESIVVFCFDGDQDDFVLRERILQVFIGDLLLISYGETNESQAITKKTQEIIFKIIEYTEEKTEKLTSEQTRKWLCLYKVVRKLQEIPSDIIHKFFQEILGALLMQPSELKIENAFACQDKWTFEFLSEATRTNYLQFVLVFRSEEIIQVLQHAVESVKSETVNIKVLCHILTLFLVQHEESSKLFDDFVEHCLVECFENCDVLKFHLVLLLRRQAALEGSHLSTSYSTWFEQKFVTKGSSLELNTKKTIHFFFKSLTQLVPYDKPEFLKVHIFKSSQVSTKFKHFVDDYVALAKTRLADLKEPLEDNSGLFAQSSSKDEHVKVMEQAQVDVEKCITLYEQSGKIPNTIMEASIFKKPYFIGRFLPTLLRPRNLPLEADVRIRLIDDLNRAGKIPAAMFKSYKRKCEQFEDFSSDDKPRDNVQQLTDCLNKLPNLLVTMVTGSDGTQDLKSWLSTLSRKLKLIFGPSSQDNTAGTTDLDVAALNMDRDSTQASYVIINVFCRACAAVQNACSSEAVSTNRALLKFRWASKFVSVLVSFPRLIQSLYVHLWSTISHEPHLLSLEHIHGLAILICQLSCFKKSYNIPRQSTTFAENDCQKTFIDFISSRISLSSKISTQFFLRWCCHYIQYALIVFQTLTTDLNQLSTDGQSGFAYVPKIMIIKMEYLFNKLKFKTGEHNGTAFCGKNELEILSLLMKSLHEAGLLQNQSCLSFKQWLVLELSIHEDFLLENERPQYYNWVIYENFLPILKDENDDDFVAHQRIATEIVSSLLDHWTRSPKMEALRTRSPTETNLIKILQDFSGLMGSSLSYSERTNDVWFLEYFISRLKKIESDENPSNEIQLRCEITAFVRLATLLPPWLLVANAEWETLNDENTKTFSRFLNESLKPSLFQGSLVLPFDFTAHVLKIFVKHSKPGDENSTRKEEEMFRCFITNTPFFLASFVHYWNQLKPFYQFRLASSDTLQQLHSYHVWLTSILTITEQPPQHHDFTQDFVCSEVGQSYCLFLHLLKTIQNAHLEVQDFRQRLNAMLDRLLAFQTGKRIIILFYDNIMAYLAGMVFQEDMHDKLWFEISALILFRCTDVLCVFTQELNENPELLSTRRVFFERKIYRSLPLVFFRIVTYQERNIISQKLPADDFTKAVLLMYIECTALYQNVSDSAVTWKPLDLDAFVKITMFVKDYLNHIDSTVLPQIPEFIVVKLPKEVQRYFSR